jgi:hypothetical protein
VFPPYAPDEVAEAVQAWLAAIGLRLASLTVTADDRAREWRLEARREDGSELVARYPFAIPEGINVPAEIAEWFAERVAAGE